MNPELLETYVRECLADIERLRGSLWRLYDYEDMDAVAVQLTELREHAGRVQETLRQRGLELLEQARQDQAVRS